MAYRTPEGIPFREDPGLLTPEEYENVALRGDFRCRVFDLTNAKEMEDYVAVWQKISDGAYVKLREMFMNIPDHPERQSPGGWRACLQWLELYAVPPGPTLRRPPRHPREEE